MRPVSPGKTGLTAARECEALLPVLEELMSSEREFREQLYQLKHMQAGLIRIGAFTSQSCRWHRGMDATR